MTAKIAAGVVKLACEAVAREYAIGPAELLSAAGLEQRDVDEAGAPLPMAALEDVLRFALERTRDPGLGLRLAQALDLRLQGFWGYALLSSSTLRQRIEIQIRYRRLRGPSELSLRVVGERAQLDIVAHGTPPDLLPVMLDWAVATSLLQHGKGVGSALPGMQVWLSYPERPHHRALRALASGPFEFAAPYNRLEFPVRDLDLALEGDPHLGALATAQLDKQLARLSAAMPEDVLDDVRERLLARLASDASLARVAHDLRVSARTLRRRLEALGASFQELLEEVRHARALSYLSETDETIERVAAQLGYADPSNFRRAFRRWTGVAPSDFRAKQRSPQPGRAVSRALGAARNQPPMRATSWSQREKPT